MTGKKYAELMKHMETPHITRKELGAQEGMFVEDADIDLKVPQDENKSSVLSAT